MKISVIIPVYNASVTLDRCLSSLASQSHADLEAVLVDDCSTDGSLALLRQFASSHSFVKIISHSQNRGVAAARNSGLDAATGDYVYFLDADDWLETEALADMTSKALQEDLDIVGCEWELAFEHSGRRMSQPDFSTPAEALRQMMCGRMKWNLWLFLVRRTLYEGLRFVPGQDMGEDMLVMHRLFLKASKVGLVKEALYHYALPGMSGTFSEKHVSQICANVSVLESVIASSACAEKLLPLMPLLKLNIKLPLLISSDRKQYRRWLEWWPEANAFVTRNPVLPCRTKLLQWCAARKMWIVLQAYDLIVTRFLYGVIYR